MEDCIFCKILKGEIPTRKIYEDDLLMVIMNIAPATNGHLLVIPKKHQTNIFDVEEEFITDAFKVIRENIYPLLKERLNSEGLTIAENNELGQDIRHFHFHLIPRYKDDNADMKYNEDLLLDIEEIFNKLTK